MELKIENLTKCYNKNRTALDCFNFTFTEGIYGLLGPNGAGKSTLMNLITDNLKATNGNIFFDGKNIQDMGREYRRLLGYMPQQQGLYPSFTLRHFLQYMAELKGIEKKVAGEQIEWLMDTVHLSDYADRKLGTFSGGMKQRALLAQALLGDAKVVVLDEPTAGLDPKERIRIRNLILEVSFDKIVLIATHVVSDVELIAKEIVLLKEGKVIENKSPAELCEALLGKVYELACDEENWQDVCNGYVLGNLTRQRGKIYARAIADAKPEVADAQEVYPVLDDVYLYYFEKGKETNDGVGEA